MSGAKIFGCTDVPIGRQWIPIKVNSAGELGIIMPRTSLHEDWQDFAIDPVIWTVANPATGAAWGVDAVYVPHLMARTSPNANETARMRSNEVWVCGSGYYGNNTLLSKFSLAFEMRLNNVNHLDNGLTFFGLSSGGMATRATNTIICFALLADALQTVTDNAGVETVNTGFGETLTNHNLFQIEVIAGAVNFYLNRNLIATHITNIPNIPMYINFYADTNALGAATIGIGQVLAWTEGAV